MRKIIMILLVITLASFAACSGCKSFEPVTIEGQPDECNDFYSVLRYYVKGGADSAFVGTVYQECKAARSENRKALREKHCKELFFGAGNVDKTDYKRYAEYIECSKN